MITEQQVAAKPTSYADIEKLSALYDRIYDIADRLFKKYNPCNIHSENGKSRCTCHLHSTDRFYLCCTGCKYISPTGCTVKCLGCKLFLCPSVRNKVLRKRLRRLKEYGRKHLTFTYYRAGWGKTPFSYFVTSKYFTSKGYWLKQIEGAIYGK